MRSQFAFDIDSYESVEILLTKKQFFRLQYLVLVLNLKKHTLKKLIMIKEALTDSIFGRTVPLNASQIKYEVLVHRCYS